MNDDELEAHLRRVFADPARRLPDTLVPLEGVHDGARRRKARRQALSAVAGASAGVLAVVAFVGIGHLTHGATTTAASGTTPVVPSSTSVGPRIANPSASPLPRFTDERMRAQPPRFPSDFAALSVTAIGANTWWVLGTECRSRRQGRRSQPLSSSVTPLRRDCRPAQPSSGSPTASMVGRSAAADGNRLSLWRTSNGGASWRNVPLKGVVGAIELGGGEAYALVESSSNNWAVWQSAADGSTSWRALGSLGSLPVQPVLAVQSGRAIVANAMAGTVRTWVFQSAGHTSSNQPCDMSLGAHDISATVGGVWLSCANGTGDVLWRSDDGSLWASVAGGNGTASRIVVGAIEASKAAMGQQDGHIYVVTTTGGNTRARGPFDASWQWTYIAFTNKKDGFALDLGGRMLRTVDGGQTWTRLAFR